MPEVSWIYTHVSKQIQKTTKKQNTMSEKNLNTYQY